MFKVGFSIPAWFSIPARFKAGIPRRVPSSLPFAHAQGKTAIAGYTLIIFTFGVMGGWAAVAPLDRGVVAQGVVMIEDSRKVVQHLEGGMVSEISVREGQSVVEGQLLVNLSPLQASSGLETVRSQLDGALALEASLVAEIDRRDRITFPPELLERQAASPVLARIVQDQTLQFEERKRSRATQITLIESKISAARVGNGRHRRREVVDREADRFPRRGVDGPSFAEGAGVDPDHARACHGKGAHAP